MGESANYGPRELAAGWFGNGDGDWATARMMLAHGGPFAPACFHSQQAAEKWLKAFLIFHERRFPYTCHLEKLVKLCGRARPDVVLPQEGLAELSAYSVKAPYDLSFHPTPEVAARALELAEHIRQILVSSLPEDSRPPAL